MWRSQGQVHSHAPLHPLTQGLKCAGCEIEQLLAARGGGGSREQRVGRQGGRSGRGRERDGVGGRNREAQPEGGGRPLLLLLHLLLHVWGEKAESQGGCTASRERVGEGGGCAVTGGGPSAGQREANGCSWWQGGARAAACSIGCSAGRSSRG